MAKLTEYPQATTFDANDIFIKDGTGGTKKITIEDVVKFIIKYPNANLAPDYSASSTYIKNELVIHDGELYKAKDNIETAEAWNSAHWEKTKISIALSQLDEDIRAELENKANIDGSYIDLTAGASHQLISAVTVEDQTPYTFRTSGGSVDIGDRETDMIVGGTVAWNQLVSDGNFADGSGWRAQSAGSSISVSDGVATVTHNSGSISAYNPAIKCVVPGVLNHIYYVNITSMLPIDAGLYLGGVAYYLGSSGPANEWNETRKFIKPTALTSGGNLFTYIGVGGYTSLSEGSQIKFKKIAVYDLTQMFGTTIADYIYSLEQANPGDGVAWFKKLFPKDYYAYDTGSLQSVQTSAHKMVGFNAYDNATGTAQLIGGMQYQITGTYTTLSYSTGETITPDADGYFTPTSNGTLTVTGGNGTTTCVHLVWDGEKDGEYEPYVEHSYALDDSLTLRGVPTLDESNKLCYNGDTYESDGTLTRRFASVDMGTLAWRNNSTDSVYVSISDRKSGSQLGVCTGFTQVPANTGVGNMAYGTYKLYGTSDSVAVKVEGITLSNASEKLSGIYLIYELDTPTTETAAPYTNPQIVDDFGTEEYVDAGVEAGTRDVAIPVGHETLYYPNLRAKLEMAPNSPDGNGDYIVRQINGQNAYVPFSDAEALGNKANVEGEYDDLTSGQSKQLVSNIGITDQALYNFRTSGGSIDIGDRETDIIVGGTVVWNQGVPNGNFENTSGWTATIGILTIADNVATLKYVGTADPGNARIAHRIHELHANHIIMVSAQFRASVDTTSTGFLLYASDRSNLFTDLSSIPANTWVTVAKFIKPTEDYVDSSRVYVLPNWQNTRVGEIYEIKNVETFDLTQMFGATIADYIYSLEQANAGDGVAWFKKLFPKDYYAYDVGSLQSVQTSVHRMVGFNAWDEEWESGSYASATGVKSTDSSRIRSKNYIPVIPGQSYYLKVPGSANLFLYDENKNYLRYRAATNSVVQLDENAHYVTFSVGSSSAPITTYNHDICLNLSWDGERDGEYEPYKEYSYPLDDSLTLHGVPKLNANNKLIYDGDTYESDGTLTRRFGMVDLGTLTWSYASSHAHPYFYATKNDAYKAHGVRTTVCQKYTSVENMRYVDFGASDYNNCVCITGQSVNTSIIIQDSTFTDAAAFKTAMSGVYMIYELATPTTETAAPYTNPQIVDDFGTEEYVDAGVKVGTRDVAIPVGHETFYQANLRAKLEMAPNSPDGNGDYIVRQINGQNTYVPFSDAEALDNKANVKGEYDDLTSGQSKQLVSTVGIEDQVPYNFRTSGGSIDIGDRETDIIVGGTIAWNQSINGNSNFSASSGATITPTVDRVATFTASASGQQAYKVGSIVKNHIYLGKVSYKTSIATTEVVGRLFSVDVVGAATTNWQSVYKIYKSTATSGASIGVKDNRESGWDAIQVKEYQIFDLTQMFGPDIANYVYSLRLSSTGAEVAWFKKLFPNDYYAYDVGTLQSVQTSAHKMVGFNAWDEEWEVGAINGTTGANSSGSNVIRSKNYIPVISNTVYYFTSSANLALRYYDADKNYLGNYDASNKGDVATTGGISNRLRTMPSNCAYLRFYTWSGYGETYKHDICINLSWDGEKDGTYEPYVEHTYPLDDSLTLRGVPKLNANNELYYDGDTYESDGTVTRRYGIVDLGTLTWSYREETGRFYTAPNILPNALIPATSNEKPNAICAKLDVVKYNLLTESDKTMTIIFATSQSAGAIWAKDSAYTDASTFTAAMSGVYLIYEFATPTTESSDSYTNPQIVDDFGTEEYIDAGVEAETRDVAIPVGHQTFYQANLRAKLEMAPDSPSGGESQYVVYHDSDGNNTYVPLIIPKEIPDVPSEAGTYALRLVVDSHGQYDMTWIPEA